MIEIIEDFTGRHEAMLLAESVVESPLHLHAGWLNKRKLAAVPVTKWSSTAEPLGIHFLDRDAEWIAAAANNLQYHYCYAVPISGSGAVYRLLLEQSTLLEFSRMCAGQSYVIIPKDVEFAILCTTEGYNVLAGSYEFVSQCLGVNILVAHEEFRRSAEDFPESGHQEIWRRYRHYTGMVISPITMEQDIERYQRLAHDITDGPVQLRQEWIVDNDLAVAPIDSGTLSSLIGHTWVRTAMARVGYTVCVAVSTESNECYYVPMTLEGLISFRRECGGLNYVLVSEDGKLAILYTSEDYDLIAGPQDFVVAAVGSTIPAAYSTFRRCYADDQSWGEGQRKLLLSVADRYEELMETT